MKSWEPNTDASSDALCAGIAAEPDGGEGMCTAHIGATHYRWSVSTWIASNRCRRMAA
jgi:hypothetical protein